MNNTPETDAMALSFSRTDHNWRQLSRKLERERDEAREEIKILRLDAQREAEHHDRLVKELENLYDKLKSQRS